MRFPKTLHFVWIGNLKDIPQEDRFGPMMWQAMNKNYEVKTWSESSIVELIKQEFPQYYELWHKINLPIKQADLARLLVLITEGGGYIDYDLKCKKPIDTIWESGVIYNRGWDSLITLPDEHSIDRVNFETYDRILNKENARIDTIGFGVANGCMFTRPGDEILVEFIEQQKDCHKGKVLDFMGPFAFTRFLRSRIDKLKGSTCLLPSHYFLFEKKTDEEPFPDYCVSTHPAVNSWGVSTKKKFWDVSGPEDFEVA